MHCQSCGASLPTDARFCAQCGAAQQPQPALPQRAETSTRPAEASAVPLWRPSNAQVVPAARWSGRDPSRDDEYRRFGAATRSFTTRAIITFVLYLVFWLPGAVANIVYWREANNVQRVTGRAPESKGCLVAMLWLFAILPALLVLALIL